MTVYSVLIPETESQGYGIKVVSEKRLYDISRNFEAVSKFCDRCNTYSVDPAHFDSLLEDFLSINEDF